MWLGTAVLPAVLPTFPLCSSCCLLCTEQLTRAEASSTAAKGNPQLTCLGLGLGASSTTAPCQEMEKRSHLCSTTPS